MKLKARKAFRLGRVTYARGSEVVLAERLGRDLLARGYVEEVAAPKTEEKTKPKAAKAEPKPASKSAD